MPVAILRIWFCIDVILKFYIHYRVQKFSQITLQFVDLLANFFPLDSLCTYSDELRGKEEYYLSRNGTLFP